MLCKCHINVVEFPISVDNTKSCSMEQDYKFNVVSLVDIFDSNQTKTKHIVLIVY